MELGVRPLLLSYRPDVIHAHDLDTLPAAVHAAEVLGCSVVYDAHELEVERMPPKSWYERRLILRKERQFIPRANAFITVSPSIARHYQDHYHLPKVQVLYNTPKFNPKDKPVSDIRSDCAVAGDAFLGVYVGAVGHGRGVETLLEAFSKVPDAYLAMVGPRRRTWQPILDELIERWGLRERVYQLEPVSSKHVVAYITTASFGIYTMQDTCLNHRYAMPNNIFEMTFAGLPIIGPALVDIGHYLAETGVGFTVNPDNADDIAAGIERMRRKGRDYRPNAARVQEITEKYGWQRQQQELQHLYTSLSDRRVSRRVEPAHAA
jgi:glycosyltransferase involved in cell wall biosynthesis